MPKYYPVFLDLRGRQAVVIGGGPMGAEKVRRLLECQAAVTVIASSVEGSVKRLAQEGNITWIRRRYRPGDLKGAFIAVVADTSSDEVNTQAFQEATERNLPLNVADVTRLCTFITPSVVRRGEVTVAVSTGGASPALSRRFRDVLSGSSPLRLRHPIMEYADLAPLLSGARAELRRTGVTISNEHWQACLTDDLVDLVQAGNENQARKALMADLVKGASCGCQPGTCRMWDELVAANGAQDQSAPALTKRGKPRRRP